MNLHLSAVRTISLAGEDPVVFWNKCDLWQTPTKITRHCLEQESVKDAYFEWVMSLNNSSQDIVDKHIKDVEKFLEDNKELEIEWYEM